MSKRLRQAVRWPQAWERPFESTASLLAKMKWINASTVARFVKGPHGAGDSESILLAMLAASRTRKETIPDSYTGTEERARIVYCVECLKAGFHSRLPQLVGLDSCPIHFVPFNDTCPRCKRYLDSFGSSDFRRTPVYLCPHCAGPLVDPSLMIWADWAKLSNERIKMAFTPFAPGLQAAHKKLEGCWNVHPVDYPYIYYYLTGYVRTDLCWVSSTRRIAPKMKCMDVMEYRFPKNKESLEIKTDSIMQYDDRVLMQSERGEKDIVRVNGRVPVLNSYLARLDVWTGMDCLHSALSVRGDILSEVRRWRSLPNWMNDMYYKSGVSFQFAQQIGLLCAAHSLDHIFYQLTILKWYCETHHAESLHEYGLGHTSINFLSGYSGELRAMEKHEGHFVFRTSVSRWLPNFQLKVVDDEIVLRIFRAVPRPPLNIFMMLKGIRSQLERGGSGNSDSGISGDLAS
jgi:hypothetical protein